MTSGRADLATVRTIEEHSFEAWPALETERWGGWLFRFAEGYTKRANSANAIAPTLPFDDVLIRAERLYAARGLPLVFRLSPLAGDEPDCLLAERGFARIDETLVMTAPISGTAPVSITAPLSITAPVSADGAIELYSQPVETWSDGFAQAHGISAARRVTHERMLAAVGWPAVFAMLSEGGEAIAFGMAVLQHDLIGLFDIVTRPEHRGRGAGRRITSELLAWGGSLGAKQAYLQVTEVNQTARRLYERCGFVEAYRYHYRVQPKS